MTAIDAMRDSDWPEVRAIYRAGLRTGVAAFMKNPPSWKAWDKGHLAVGRRVVRRAARVLHPPSLHTPTRVTGRQQFF